MNILNEIQVSYRTEIIEKPMIDNSHTAFKLFLNSWNMGNIELLEEFESDKKDLVKEMTYVQEYIVNGFQVKNNKQGQSILDPESYIKVKNDRHKAMRHPDYHNWCSSICQKAKKEGLSSKEYRIKYSIPDYLGPKKITD